MDEANALISGASVVASASIALFFLAFWRRSHDRLFAIFALAFAVFAANRQGLVLLGDDNENATWVYSVRLVAFMLILAAIVDKNRRETPAG